MILPRSTDLGLSTQAEVMTHRAALRRMDLVLYKQLTKLRGIEGALFRTISARAAHNSVPSVRRMRTNQGMAQLRRSVLPAQKATG